MANDRSTKLLHCVTMFRGHHQGLGMLLWRDSTAATTAEYAVLLALVVAGLLVAGQALSDATRDSFDEIVLVETSAPSALVTLDAAADNAVRAKVPAHWTTRYAMLVERCAMLVMLVACFMLLRRQRQATPSKAVAAEETKLPTGEQLQVYQKRQQIYHILSTNIDSLFNSQMQVQHLMSKRVVTVKPRSTVSRMKQLMSERQVRHLLVCDDMQQLLGIISDRDLHCDVTLTAQHVMTTTPITVPPDALVGTVISLLLKEQISALPIVQEGRIYGLMTTTDLMMAMQCALQLWSQMSDDVNVSALVTKQESFDSKALIETDEHEPVLV